LYSADHLAWGKISGTFHTTFTAFTAFGLTRLGKSGLRDRADSLADSRDFIRGIPFEGDKGGEGGDQ